MDAGRRQSCGDILMILVTPLAMLESKLESLETAPHVASTLWTAPTEPTDQLLDGRFSAVARKVKAVVPAHGVESAGGGPRSLYVKCDTSPRQGVAMYISFCLLST